MVLVKKIFPIAFLIILSLLTCNFIVDPGALPNAPETTAPRLDANIHTVKTNDGNQANQAIPLDSMGTVATASYTSEQLNSIRDLPAVSSQPTKPSASQLVAGLTEEDVETLSQLPPMCTGELPGLDLSGAHSIHQQLKHQQQFLQHQRQFQQHQFQQPRNKTRQSLRAISNAPTPPTNFIWPNVVPKDNRAQLQTQFDATQAGFSYDAGNAANQATPISTSHDRTYQSVLERVAKNPTPSTMPNPHASASARQKSSDNDDSEDGEDPHFEIYSRSAFPSAKECATCHEQIYEEWSTSSHAYASVSPMFHKFENTINRLAQGTLGYFCLRCHAPVATTMGLRRDQAIWDGPRVFKEGVTCVACHRVKTPYTKADGERRIEPGDIYAPVYGSADGSSVEIANKYSSFFKTKTNRNEKGPGLPIHKRAIQFEELSESSFCMSCHQVAVKPGIKLEVVWDQYRASPACKDGVNCQDCHMGKVPGVDAGYSYGPAAVVNGKVLNPERRHSNHMFFGPGYSIAHPGTFPDNLDADRWKFNEWLTFDWRAGWGTDEFEDALADGKFHYEFPHPWQEADDRYEAREIIDENLKKLDYKKDLRRQVLENGSKLDGPYFTGDPTPGEPLRFRYCLTNTSPGHNMPSGSLGAQPQMWMNVALRAPSGQLIWESGYLDSNGDLCDNHSLDVLARRVPLDTQLMNLQTKFLTTNVKGTDREMYLPINFDFDQLPFLRPAQVPVSVLNHPPFIRMEGHSIPALGSRNVKYVVPSRLMQQPGTYQLSVRMRSRAEPIYFMRFCDATPEMERIMNEYIADFHSSTVVFEVH